MKTAKEFEKKFGNESVIDQIFDFLNEKFNGCEVELRDGTIYYKKDGYCLFEQDKKTQVFWIDYYSIWEVIEDKFGLNHNEVKSIIRNWVREVKDLKEYTVKEQVLFMSVRVREVKDLKEYTAGTRSKTPKSLMRGVKDLKEYTALDGIGILRRLVRKIKDLEKHKIKGKINHKRNF